MEIVFVRSWQALALRGATGLLFGLAVFLWPAITLATLAVLFGGYSLADGLFATAAGTRQRGHAHGWILALEGLVGIGVGFAAILWTGLTVPTLVTLIALWAIATGILEMAIAIRLRREIPGGLLLAAAGGGSLLLGLILWRWQGTGTLVLVIVLGSYALFFGTTMLLLGLRLRRLAGDRAPLHRTLGRPHRAV